MATESGTRLGRRENEEMLLTEFQFRKMKKFCRLAVQHCEYTSHYWTVYLKMADIYLRVFYCNKLINVYIWAYYPNQLLQFSPFSTESLLCLPNLSLDKDKRLPSEEDPTLEAMQTEARWELGRASVWVQPCAVGGPAPDSPLLRLFLKRSRVIFRCSLS